MGLGFKILKKLSENRVKKLNVPYNKNNKIISMIGKSFYTRLKPEFIEKFGYKLYLDPEDQLMLSVNEYPLHPILKKIIHLGDSIIDVGANIGILTLFFRKLVGDEGMIYSFEPNPIVFSILEKNIKENNLINIQIENKAVSNRDGKVQFIIDSSITSSKISEKGENTIDMDCVTLDNYFLKKDIQIDFVKIDTEGFDWTVIQGMKNIIKINPKIKILIEFHTSLIKESGTTVKKFLKIIQDLNFIIYDLGGLFNKMELLNTDDLEVIANIENYSNATNLLCLPKQYVI